LRYLKPTKVVLIGASTGGPGQIDKIITKVSTLEKTAIIIAQHMAEGFIDSFMSTVQKSNKYQVVIAQSDTLLSAKTIYLSEKNTLLTKHKETLVFQKKEKIFSSYNPDINYLFSSFSPFCSELKMLSVILTGIGEDGVNACVDLSNHGARCLTETSHSAIIDGMPMRARELVPNIEAYSIEEIAKIISEFCE